MTTDLPRLSARTLGRVQAAAVPAYDRSAEPTIVHLGMGAFARAHLGVYADDLLRNGWPATIRAVSLRSSRAEQQLAPQDGLYSVTEREAGDARPPQVVGSVTSVSTGTHHAIDAIANPAVSMVTLTITEKGYEPSPADQSPAADPAEPTTAPEVLVAGLRRRHLLGLGAPVVVSLDNLLDNGSTLRSRAIEVADRIDASFARWVAQDIQFPNSVVDRMVPTTTPADIEEIARHLGVLDEAAVTAERHRSWVVTACPGLPPLDDVGVEVVSDTSAYQRRKLWLLNAPHSALAYRGLQAGCVTIAEAAEHAEVHDFVRRLQDEILEVADLPATTRPKDFAAEAMVRFRNPSLGHTCVQVGADGSRKLQQRLFPVVRARIERGLPTTRFAIVVATWLAAAGGVSINGRPLPALEDPSADALHAAADQGDLQRLVEIGLGNDLEPRFAAEVAHALTELLDGRAIDAGVRS